MARKLSQLERDLVTEGVSAIAHECEWPGSKRHVVTSTYQRTVYHQRFLGDPRSLGSRTYLGRAVRQTPVDSKDLWTDDIFALEACGTGEHEKKIVFCMWVTQQEFDAWRVPRNEKVLHDMLPLLDVVDGETVRSADSAVSSSQSSRMPRFSRRLAL